MPQKTRWENVNTMQMTEGESLNQSEQLTDYKKLERKLYAVCIGGDETVQELIHNAMWEYADSLDRYFEAVGMDDDCGGYGNE